MEYSYQNEFLKERLSNDNLRLSDEIIHLLKEYSDKQYFKSTYLRAAHTKTHGLLKAKLHVKEDIPQEFKKGIFSKSKIYDGLIRISNASPLNPTKTSPDFRGLSLKIIDIDNLGNNQDFLFTSSPTLTIKSIQWFKELFTLVIKGKILPIFFYAIKTKSLPFIFKYFRKNKTDLNPIKMSFWSVTASQLENTVVKYKIVPNKENKYIEDTNGHSLLDKIQNVLSRRDVIYDFYVQQFVSNEITPIEDISTEWREDIAPFTKIGELIIPKQHFNKDELFDLVKQINFSPGNSIQDHFPLGQLNLSRAYVYDIMFRFRTSRSNIQPIKVTQQLFDNLNYDITRSI